MNDKITNDVSSIKDILSNLPKNNVKNQRKYISTANEYLDTYNKYKDKVFNEIKNRYDDIMSIKSNFNEEDRNEEIQGYYDNLYLFMNNSSYEKSGLDIVLFDLSHYYNENLDKVINDINKAINIFKGVGINLKSKDFNYSLYSNVFMNAYFNNVDKDNNINYIVLHETFNNIYWKCSDLIFHIELNFKYLYQKNIKIFDRYYNNLYNNVLKSFGMNLEEYLNKYKELKRDYDKDKFEDINLIIRRCLNKDINININDFLGDKIDKLYSEYVIGEVTDKTRINNSFLNLYHSLNEYKNYELNISLINSVRELYKDKDKYKGVLANKYKDIAKNEKKLFGLNKKFFKLVKSNKKKEVSEKLNSDINNLIMDTWKLYDELLFDRFREYVSKLEDSNSCYDILWLCSSNYVYLRSVLKKDSEEISDEDIDKFKDSLFNYLISPYNNLISNVGFNDDKNLQVIISDKYKLMNLNVVPDSIDISNIDSIIDSAYKILLYDKIIKSKVSVEDIKFVCDANEIVNDKN